MKTVFRPKGNLIWAGLAIILDGLFIYQAVFYPTGSLLIDIALAVFIASTAYLLWIKPKLVLRDTDLVVVNPFKRVVIPYSEITDLKTKWTLQIEYGERSVQVWVAPANGKRRWIAESTFRWRNSRVPLTEDSPMGFTSMSQSLDSDSGLAASLIRARLKH